MARREEKSAGIRPAGGSVKLNHVYLIRWVAMMFLAGAGGGGAPAGAATTQPSKYAQRAVEDHFGVKAPR
jgi:hypothetical protein